MPSKRKPITFSELNPPGNTPAEAKGRGAILRSAAEVAAEQTILETQKSRNPEIQNGEYPELQQTGIMENQQTGIPEVENAGNRARYPKATYRISPEALMAIEETKFILRRRYKVKVNLEEIAEE